MMMMTTPSDPTPPPGRGSDGVAPSLGDLDSTSRRMRRQVGSKFAGVVAVAVLAFVVQGLVRNSALQWSVVGQYLFSSEVLSGLWTTLEITVAAIAIAVVLGTLLANMRLSKNVVLRVVNGVYVWFFRSVPLLVLLIFAYNFSLLYTNLSLGVPFGPSFVTFATKDFTAAMTAAILTFGLQQAAYTSEVIRAAIVSVPRGQAEAAEALGMTDWRVLRRVILPQAARLAIPPIANETINLCKSTALVAFISVPDLLYSVQEVYSRTFQVVPLLVVATIWYTVIVSVLSALQWWLERFMNGPSRSGRARLAARETL
ncbi:MAG: amino acid ABC transporter permease [Acidobacteriota bacterium]|nr:amino acid ABC transporter permease [Acidobacteriota bacterium]